MRKNIIILLIVLFIFLFSFWFNSVSASCQKPEDCGKGARCENGECKRMLELVYPSFGADDKYVPKTVGVGLPKYILYIFRFSIGIVGFVIFAALIYAGVDYLFFCAGNPKKLMEALDRLKSAGIGALILLCSYLIFNTINPQLITLELEKMTSLPGVITPGVYICNYEYKGTGEDELGTILNNYITKTGDEQLKAVEKFKNVIINPKDNKKNCRKLNFSDNFDFTVKKNDTFFMVPTLKIDPNDYKKRIAEYEYGIILHEKDYFRGQCVQQPLVIENIYKKNFESFQLNLGSPTLPLTSIKSVTLFKKPSISPDTTKIEGVTFYSCYNFNRSINFCPKDITPTSTVFKPEDDSIVTKQIALEENLKGEIRSVKISPKDYYFAVVRDQDQNCAILRKSDVDLANLPSLNTGCGKGCNMFDFTRQLKSCAPCIHFVRIYVGQVL